MATSFKKYMKLPIEVDFLAQVSATPRKPVDFKCEFVDQVPEHYFCKVCKSVAKDPTIATCCTEVFCKACIGYRRCCPNCHEYDGIFLPHKKYRSKIPALKVYCSLKDRGCEWTGQLQYLDAHLDLTTGDCVYVDVYCPSKCYQKIQKHNLNTHLTNHCPNRDYTCPHCSFKATYQKVSEHFEVCQHYPLECPNRCGTSFKRNLLEDHMKICSMRKVQCEFNHLGCEAESALDQQKEHMEHDTQKHIALMAAATLKFPMEVLDANDSQTKLIKEQQNTFEMKTR